MNKVETFYSFEQNDDILVRVSILTSNYFFSKQPRQSLSISIFCSRAINLTEWLRIQVQASLEGADSEPQSLTAGRLSNKGISNYSGSVASKWIGLCSIVSPSTYTRACLTFL